MSICFGQVKILSLQPIFTYRVHVYMFQYGVVIPFLLRILIRMRRTRTTLILDIRKQTVKPKSDFSMKFLQVIKVKVFRPLHFILPTLIRVSGFCKIKVK